MKLPTFLKITCFADDRPIHGVCVELTMKTKRKNDFHFVSAPTDSSGQTTILWSQIKASAELDVSTFVMDYTGLGDFSGEIVVTPMNRERIKGALSAYALYHGAGLAYPPHYAEPLGLAERLLSVEAPAKLRVEVEHDGEEITIQKVAVMA